METQGYKMETYGYKSVGVQVSEEALHDGDGCAGGLGLNWTPVKFPKNGKIVVRVTKVMAYRFLSTLEVVSV